ncbi:MAG: hypothetical protein HOH19_08090 [Kordiimonadaceae bacterium]|nr:hypothetical protein [Kordiimonadaceae bacterium]
MTTVFNTYSFMDLLKDYNYVPETVQSENNLLSKAITLIAQITGIVKSKTEDYDFMDLLGDNGCVPVNDNWVKSHTNDNAKLINIAS